MKRFNTSNDKGYYFSYETDDLELVYKLTADNISYKEADSTFRLTTYKERIIRKNQADIIRSSQRKDTVFNFSPDDLAFIDSKALELTTSELNEFIQSAEVEVKNLNTYYVQRYKELAYRFQLIY